MSTQERIDVRARDGWADPATGRPTGGAGTTGAGGRGLPDRLPRPPGRRRPGLAVLAVLMIVLGAAVAGLLALRVDDRVEVLVARRTIAVGQQITTGDLAVARMSSSGVAVIRADQAAQVVGRYAGQQISAGRLLDGRLLTTNGLLTPGRVAIGISLAAGRYPANGLETGDVVMVVRAANGTGKVLTPRAVVGSVKDSGDSGFGASGSTTAVVTLVVGEGEAATVAAAAMAEQVSLALVSRGGPAGGG